MTGEVISTLLTFWLKHPEPFIYHLSGKYTITPDQVRKYKDLLHWRELSGNPELKWSISLIDEYMDYLLVKSPPYTEDEIKGITDVGLKPGHFHWGFHTNESLPWSVDFMDRYKDRFSWFLISQYPPIEIDAQILEKFKDHWDWWFVSAFFKMPWGVEFMNTYRKKIDFNVLPMNASFNDRINPEMMEIFKEENPERHAQFQKYLYESRTPGAINEDYRLQAIRSNKEVLSQDDIEYAFQVMDTEELIFNPGIPWSPGFIDYYADEFDWISLCDGFDVPFTEELIEKYLDRVHFGNHNVKLHQDWIKLRSLDIEPEYHPGLSANNQLPWSENLILKYVDKWDWTELSGNNSIPWSVSLIDSFVDNWNWKALSGNDFWTSDLMARYSNQIDWSAISANFGYDWSLGLLLSFEDKWDYNSMCYNDEVYDKFISPLLKLELVLYFFENLLETEVHLRN